MEFHSELGFCSEKVCSKPGTSLPTGPELQVSTMLEDLQEQVAGSWSFSARFALNHPAFWHGKWAGLKMLGKTQKNRWLTTICLVFALYKLPIGMTHPILRRFYSTFGGHRFGGFAFLGKHRGALIFVFPVAHRYFSWKSGFFDTKILKCLAGLYEWLDYHHQLYII